MSVVDVLGLLEQAISSLNPEFFASYDFTGGLLSSPLTIVMGLALTLLAVRWVL